MKARVAPTGALAALAALTIFACSRQAAVETGPRPPTPTPIPAERVSIAPTYPGAEWERVEPEAAGYSRADLDRLHGYVAGLNTSAVMAVVGGRVIFEHGKLDSLSYLASVRKSILAMLYGNYVEDGVIDLGATLEDLGMDDVQGLLPIEKRATVYDLITARSGIYHPASNPGDNSADAPPRGSQEPGTYMLYNNWDFNAAGAVFEQMTGRNIYDALERDLAIPLGFRDWRREIHRKSGDASRSRNLAYHMVLSTRDMARVGYLMLRDGRWEDRQVIPADWAARIRSVVTPLEEMNPTRMRDQEFGYGYMWWVWDGPSATGAFAGAYAGRGAYGQFITVLPALDMVVAHKTVPDNQTGWGDYMGILTRLVDAHCAPDCPDS
jgi:CubicO group peptidase (beta-lactamase class C family)